MPDISQLLLTDIFSCIVVSGISCAHQAKNHKFHPFDTEEYKYIADTVISLELSRLANKSCLHLLNEVQLGRD